MTVLRCTHIEGQPQKGINPAPLFVKSDGSLISNLPLFCDGLTFRCICPVRRSSRIGADTELLIRASTASYSFRSD